MATISRVKTWSASETLTAATLNAEFDNILTGVNSSALDATNLDATDTYTFAELIVGTGITSADGNQLHVHTASAGSVSASADGDEVVAENSGNAGISILSGNANTGNLFFGDDGDNDIGGVSYNHSTNTLSLTAGTTAVYAITSSGSSVTGTLSASGNFAINTNKFTVTAASGNTVVAGTLTATGTVTGGKLAATGDTSAGDNAAIGYTATEGLVLTGQGSTNDVTIKNDADQEVITIATGDQAASFASSIAVAGNIAVNTNKFNVTGASGNTTVAGTLGVTGATTLSSTAEVTGNLTVNTNKLIVTAASGNVTAAGVVAGTKFTPTGDTSAGDNAAIGYTSTEGLILTGQGSSNDVTIKNDADQDVMTVATGDQAATFASSVAVGNDFSVNTNKFNVTGASGNTTVAGTLGVTGVATFTTTISAATGSTIGNLTLANGSITDSSGAISFNDENVSTTGTLASGALTVTGAAVPNADDGGALGASGTGWSDLFLASGAVVNFNAGDVTVTHSANTLAVAGGTTYSFDGGASGVFDLVTTGNRIDMDTDGDSSIRCSADDVVAIEANGVDVFTINGTATDTIVTIEGEGARVDANTPRAQLNLVRDVSSGTPANGDMAANVLVYATDAAGTDGTITEIEFLTSTATAGAVVSDIAFQTTQGAAIGSGPATALLIQGANINIPGLTASQDVQTDGSKNLTSVSDKNWKNDLGLIEDALDIVNKLQPRYFTWKRDSADKKLSADQPRLAGFFAQEVFDVFPEGSPGGANMDEKGIEYWGLNSRSIMAVMAKAIQELSAEVDTLKAA